MPETNAQICEQAEPCFREDCCDCYSREVVRVTRAVVGAMMRTATVGQAMRLAWDVRKLPREYRRVIRPLLWRRILNRAESVARPGRGR
jgi:hypothetical protein